MVIVRENTEGLFSARKAQHGPSPDLACDDLRVTRQGSERLFHAAFRLARSRHRRITLVDKANVFPSMVFFRSVFDAVAREYPDITVEGIYMDAVALYLMQHPQSFDVLVTKNIFGDILSDLAAGLAGGIGMASAVEAGLHAMWPLIGGAAGNIFSGALVDSTYRRGRWTDSRRFPAMPGFPLAALGLLMSLRMSAAAAEVAWLPAATFGADMTLPHPGHSAWTSDEETA